MHYKGGKIMATQKENVRQRSSTTKSKTNSKQSTKDCK